MTTSIEYHYDYTGLSITGTLAQRIPRQSIQENVAWAAVSLAADI